MGGISTDNGDSLNIELNLVPFIDLLSSLVLFLLITAVWIQISAIPTAIDAKGETPILTPEASNLLVVHVTPAGYDLAWPETVPDAAKRPASVAKTSEGYDTARLVAAVADVAKMEKQPSAAVSADDAVEYGDVIRTIDTLKSSGLLSVAMTAN